MIVEMIAILSVLVGGAALMRFAGIKGWILPTLGFVTGIAIQIILGTVQAVTALPSTPVLTLIITLLFPLALLFYCFNRGRDVSIKIFPALLSVLLFVSAVILFREINLQCLTVDSYWYLIVSSLLEADNLNHATPDHLLTRLLAVPLMHAAANLTGEFYFRSITPLLAISTLTIMAWLTHEGLSIFNIEPWIVKLLSAAGAFLLVTSNRFVFNAFYINGHMLTAVFIMLLIGCGWLLINNANPSVRALTVLQVISIPVLTVARPENPLFIGIALLPFLVSSKVSWKHRTLLLVVLGFSVLTWYGFLWIKYYGSGQLVPLSVVGMFSFGLVSVLIAPLLAWRKIDKLLPHSLILTELGLWLVLIALAFRNFAPLYYSILATIDNIFLGYGGWGSFLVLIILIAAVLMVFTKAENMVYLRFPLTTFFPFAFLLVYLRESAYRVGHGDSLNRIFLHIVPLALLFIISTAISERWGLPERLKKICQRLLDYAHN